MDHNLVRKTKVIRKYVRKDGSIVEKEYEQKYVVKDHTALNLRKAIAPRLKTATVEQLKEVNRILGGTEDGRGNDRHADAPGNEGGSPGVAATAEASSAKDEDKEEAKK